MKKMLLSAGTALALLTLPACRSINEFLGRDHYGHERQAAARRRNATNDALTAPHQKQSIGGARPASSPYRSTGGPLDWVRRSEHKGEAFSGGGLSEQERAVVNRLDRGTTPVSATEAREIDAIRKRNQEASEAAARSIY